MKITSRCPICKTILWYFENDDSFVYNCANGTCPIDFKEEVALPEDMIYKNYSIYTGTLISFSFVLNQYFIKVSLLPKPIFEVSHIVKISQTVTSYNDIFTIPYTFEIDWEDLPAFERRLRLWILFS